MYAGVGLWALIQVGFGGFALHAVRKRQKLTRNFNQGANSIMTAATIYKGLSHWISRITNGRRLLGRSGSFGYVWGARSERGYERQVDDLEDGCGAYKA